MSQPFEAQLSTGRTTAIVIKHSEYKGTLGIDVRKHYNGGPTKKGAFLVVDKGHAEFVTQALTEVLTDRDGERILADGRQNIVVRRYDYRNMEGYSIRKESQSGNWGKGIWFTLDQGAWIQEQLATALAA